MRLNKYIAHAGICSRREADELIAAGSVKVNGKVVTEMGYMVMPGDEVQYGGEKLRSERHRYFLLNKPKGFITTTDDPQERRTVMMLMDGCCAERIYPVGRLDRATTGLLLFTNDGELAKKLTHPSTQVYKIYQVELNKPVTKEDMKKLLEGIELEDGPMHVDDIQYAAVGKTIDKRVVGVELHSGRNRIVRRLFEALGYEVHKLDRTTFAGLTKKDLPRGRWRELTEKEVGFLKMI
jgi:23S rRNA pseudouridine2605 synthase